MDIEVLTNPATNRPGIGGTIFLAEIPFFATYGAFATNTNPGDEMRITGDHTFVTGKGFVAWETEDDIATLKIPVTGARSSIGLKPELNLFLPGLDPARLWSAFQNKSFIGLIQAFGCNSTQYIQLGDVCNPLRIMPSDGFGSGVAGGNDARGINLKMGSNYSVYFYEGDVSLYP